MTQKLDIYIVSVPDSKAQTAIAQTVVKSDPLYTMQIALEMVKNPPLLLYRNLDPKDAFQRIEELKSLGIGFKISKTGTTPDSSQSDSAKQADDDIADILQAADNTGGTSVITNIAVDKDAPDDTSTTVNASDDDKSNDTPNNISANTSADAAIDKDKLRDISTAGDISAPPKISNIKPNTSNSSNDFRSGIRVGAIGLEELQKKEEEANKKNIAAVILIVGIFIVIGLAVHFFSGNKTHVITQTAIPASGHTATVQDNEFAGTGTTHEHGEAQPTNDRLRTQITGTQKLLANTYMDSAQNETDYERQIAFYKFAISFNRYNLSAWQGLLQAYRDTERHDEAQETEDQMKALFGSEVTSVSSLVKQFGDISDAYMSDDGTYRLEYRTNKRGKDDILQEVFAMTRSVRSACNCQNISIYASTGAGRGLLAHSTPKTSVHTLSAFLKYADIVWLD